MVFSKRNYLINMASLDSLYSKGKKSSKMLGGVPEDGEFVRWLRDSGIQFEEQPLYKTKEYGIYSEWDSLPKMRCRPFNKITIEGGKICKEWIDEQGKKLAPPLPALTFPAPLSASSPVPSAGSEADCFLRRSARRRAVDFPLS